jgi:hypothetical protein
MKEIFVITIAVFIGLLSAGFINNNTVVVPSESATEGDYLLRRDVDSKGRPASGIY